MLKILPNGFTLLEIMIVIAMVGILATVGLNTYPGALAKARDSQRLDDARNIVAAVQQYNTDSGSYPPASGCNPTWCNSGAGSSAETSWIGNLVSTYMSKVPQDPKDLGSPDLLYYYTTSGDDYCLEIHTEKNQSLSRNYYGTSGTGTNQIWKLRFGPYGATGGICATR